MKGQDHSRSAGSTRIRGLALLLGFLLLLLAHGAGLLFRIQPAVSLWFPPSGVAIALTLWLGPVGIPLAGLASVIMAPAWGSGGWLRLVGLVDMVEPLVAWLLYCRLFGAALTLRGLHSVIAFLLSVPLTACAASATVGCLVLAGLNQIEPAGMDVTLAQWWLGNALGTMTLVPPILLLGTPILYRRGWLALPEADHSPQNEIIRFRAHWREGAIILALAILTAFLTVMGTRTAIFLTLQLSLLGYIPVIWAAIRFGVRAGVVTATVRILAVLTAYLVLYPAALNLPFFPVNPELLHTHKLSLLLQGAIALLVGTAITERAAIQTAFAEEHLRRVEYQTQAQFSEKLFQLNRLLSEANAHLQQVEADLRRSEALNHTVLENFPNGAVFLFDTDLRYLLVEGTGLADVSLHSDQVVGKLVWEVVTPETAAVVIPAYQRALAGESCRVELPFNGHVYDVHILPVHNSSGSINAGMVITQDITDRKRAEERLDLAQAVAKIGTFEWNIQSNVNLWSPEIEALYGLEKGTFGGTYEDWAQRVHPEDLPRVEAEIQQALKTGDLLTDWRTVWQDGSIHWLQVRAKVFFDGNGQALRMVGANVDISASKRSEAERQRIELARQQSETVLNAFLTSSPVGLALLDRDLRYVYANESLAEINAVPLGEHVGRTLAEVLPYMTEQLAPIFQQVIDTQEPQLNLEFEGEVSPGVQRHSLLNTFPVCLPNRELLGVGVTVLEISELKRVEAALRQSELSFRTLADAMPQMFWITRPDGYHEYFNQRWYDYTGATLEQTRGEGWQTILHPEDLDHAQITWQHCLTTGEFYQIEYRLRQASDGEYRWHLGRALPLRDETGRILKWFGSCTDIHDQKLAIEERVQALERERAARLELERAGRMKDEFLAIVSHELRSPLNAILGWSRLLRDRKLSPEKTAQALASIERNAQSQTQLIEDLLDISRIIRGKIRLAMRPLHLSNVIQAAIDTMQPAASVKAIQITSHFNSPVGQVLGDFDRLQQVVWNLISNAVKFTPEGGWVEVRLEQVEGAEGRGQEEEGRRMEAAGEQADSPSASSPSPSSLPSNLSISRPAELSRRPRSPIPPSIHPSTSTFARITITDTGKGIRPDFLPHVFDRFRQADASSTRSEGGLGLGLAIVRNLVELHGGTTWVESAGEGQGATFIIDLPLLNTAAASPLPASPTPSAGLSLEGLRIMVVDDEADTREFLVATLEEFGAVAIAAASVQQALSHFQHDPPDILISDIGMPEEDGYSLIRKVRALPAAAGGQVPAAALTAYVRGDDQQRALAAGFQLHISKPVEPLHLIRVILQLKEGRR